jgi:hypothetical protein
MTGHRSCGKFGKPDLFGRDQGLSVNGLADRRPQSFGF